jgi:hypothetical protein
MFSFCYLFIYFGSSSLLLGIFVSLSDSTFISYLIVARMLLLDMKTPRWMSARNVINRLSELQIPHEGNQCRSPFRRVSRLAFGYEVMHAERKLGVN